MHQIPEHHGNLGWNQILGLDRAWRSWSSTNSGTTLKSMRDDGVELWGWCVTARIRSLSLAEPQHNTTQLLCHNMSCWIYLALSFPPRFLLISCQNCSVKHDQQTPPRGLRQHGGVGPKWSCRAHRQLLTSQPQHFSLVFIFFLFTPFNHCR